MPESITNHKFIEQIAGVWRELGQPNITEDMRIIVNRSIGVNKVLGMPIILSLLNPDPGIALGYIDYPEDTYPGQLIHRFDKLARDYNWNLEETNAGTNN